MKYEVSCRFWVKVFAKTIVIGSTEIPFMRVDTMFFILIIDLLKCFWVMWKVKKINIKILNTSNLNTDN